MRRRCEVRSWWCECGYGVASLFIRVVGKRRFEQASVSTRPLAGSTRNVALLPSITLASILSAAVILPTSALANTTNFLGAIDSSYTTVDAGAGGTNCAAGCHTRPVNSTIVSDTALSSRTVQKRNRSSNTPVTLFNIGSGHSNNFTWATDQSGLDDLFVLDLLRNRSSNNVDDVGTGQPSNTVNVATSRNFASETSETLRYCIGELHADTTRHWQCTSTSILFANTRPVLNNTAAISVSGSEGDAITVDLGAAGSRASDIDGDTLNWRVKNNATNGTQSISGNILTYTPSADFFGNDSLTLAVFDADANNSLESTATVTVNFSVGNVNDAPSITLTQGQAITDIDKAGSVQYQFRIEDIDGDSVDWSVQTNGAVEGTFTPTSGTVAAGSSALLQFTHNGGNGSAVNFDIVADDGNAGGVTTQAMQINVANQQPQITDPGGTLALSVDEDGAVGGQATASDADGDALTWSIVNAPANAASVVSGEVDLLADGASVAGETINFQYTPAANFEGSDSMTLQASDGSKNATLLVNITVNGINDLPVPGGVTTFAVAADTQSALFDLLEGDTDPEDGSNLVLVLPQATSASGATIVVENNQLRYTIPTPFNAIDTLSYTVRDQAGAEATAEVTISPPDTDSDGVFDALDNCPTTANGPQTDQDSDGAGDACDVDANGDGVFDVQMFFDGQQSFNQGAIGIIGSGLGEMRVTARLASDVQSELSFDWSGSSSDILSAASTRIEGASIIFNPDADNLAKGLYPLQVTFSADGLQGVADTRVVLIDAIGDTAAAQFADADRDGFPVLADNDDNDPVSLPVVSGTQNQVTTTAGNFISIGDLAAHSWSQDNFTTTAVMMQPSQFRTAVATLFPALELSLASGVSTVSGIFDIEIRNSQQSGQNQPLVIQLLGNLPAQASARVFLPAGGGWGDFSSDDNNQLASAKFSDGSCPAFGDAAYTGGLTAGDDCLALLLADGGANDSDGSSDGVLRVTMDFGSTANNGGLSASSADERDDFVLDPASGNGSVRPIDLVILALPLLMVGRRHYIACRAQRRAV